MQTIDSHRDWIVVDDPSNVYFEGSLVARDLAHQLAQRGVVLLPVDTALFKRSGVGGFMKRAWGAGYPLDYQQPRLSCPIAIFATPHHTRMAWAARLMPTENLRGRIAEGHTFEGVLQITPDSGQVGSHHAGIRQKEGPISARGLGPPADQGWIVAGNAEVSLAMEGVHGFALYGNMPGVRVAWLAASICTQNG